MQLHWRPARWLRCLGAIGLAIVAGCAAPSAPTASTSTDTRWTAAEVERQVASLEGFAVIDAGVIIMASDLSADRAQSLLDEMLAIRASIVEEFFETPPTRAVPVFCASDSLTFIKMVREITGSEPIIGTGFFTRKHFALFLNNQAGALGTGCHELTHALIAEDIGEDILPIWLNEGVASVWEWPELRGGGRYVGGSSHRITQLADAGPIPLAHLLRADQPSATGNDFGGLDSGRYQATARLLCVYLQTQNKLGELYRQSRDALQADRRATNLQPVLERVAGEPLATLESHFHAWLDQVQ